MSHAKLKGIKGRSRPPPLLLFPSEERTAPAVRIPRGIPPLARIPRLYGSVAPGPPNILIDIVGTVNRGSRLVVRALIGTELRRFTALFQLQRDFRRGTRDASG